MSVCVHRQLGLFMGITHERRTMWSHDEETVRLLEFHHPDASRTTVSWPDALTARNQLLQWLTYDDWGNVAIKSAQSDVCEFPIDATDPNEGPVMLCSMENCIRLIPHLPLRDAHRLDPHTQER